MFAAVIKAALTSSLGAATISLSLCIYLPSCHGARLRVGHTRTTSKQLLVMIRRAKFSLYSTSCCTRSFTQYIQLADQNNIIVHVLHQVIKPFPERPATTTITTTTALVRRLTSVAGPFHRKLP